MAILFRMTLFVFLAGIHTFYGLPHQAEKQDGPKDPNVVLHEGMHGEEDVNKHDWDGEQAELSVVHEPVNGERMMHDLMHGGAEHIDGPSATDAVDNDMDEVFMFGEADPGKAQVHTDSAVKGSEEHKQSRDNHIKGVLVYEDTLYRNDPSHDDSISSESESFGDILEMDLVDEQLLPVKDIEQLLKREKDEYTEWILNNPEYQDETVSGSTYIDVGDSIRSTSGLMKYRYLKAQNR